jgi:hypothetical protein
MALRVPVTIVQRDTIENIPLGQLFLLPRESLFIVFYDAQIPQTDRSVRSASETEGIFNLDRFDRS